MKCHIWTGAQFTFYGGVLAVVAENKEDAIAAILKKYGDDKYVKMSIDRDPDVYEVGEVFFLEDE